MSPSDDKSRKDPLQSVLHDVEAKLRTRLREACEAEASGVDTESAAEIRRLEDSLLGAAVAAEQAIALRRHIQRQKTEMREPAGESSTASNPTEPMLKVREFRDADGRLWRAWPVTPGQARPGRTAQRYLGEFHKGWICFEALESSARRRLPSQPAHWNDLEEPELCQLLEQAINAPQRKDRKEQADPARRPPPMH